MVGFKFDQSICFLVDFHIGLLVYIVAGSWLPIQECIEPWFSQVYTIMA